MKLLEVEGDDLKGQGHSDAIRKVKDTYNNCMLQENSDQILNNTKLLSEVFFVNS